MPDSFSQSDKEIAVDTFKFCMEHMQEHFTIQFLAKRAGISPTKLKTIFRNVYGAPLFAHIRKEKIHQAALELGKSSARIIDVAELCGYDNASKFAAAFRDVIGCSPKEYRERVRLE